jgi:hypothetical protein
MDRSPFTSRSKLFPKPARLAAIACRFVGLSVGSVFVLLASTTIELPGRLQAQEPLEAVSQSKIPIGFATDIKPILRERCFACHGSLKQESDLRLDTVRSMHAAGVLIAGTASESEIVQRIRSRDPAVRMPPEGTPLPDSQIVAIEQWIDQGAEPPRDDVPEEDPDKHWSFQSLSRPAVPATSGDRCDHPIDAFLIARMEHAGIAPRPLASRELWLRRVTLDLTGIPPTPEEIRAFGEDPSLDAYERVVARLLDSPRYGERWGRHWMDVWRYADWFGRRGVPDVWNSAPQVWRWRDWMVRSLNDDVGYDRMIQDMLAADELHPEDPESLVATGYLVRNWYALNPNDWMRNVVEHSSKAFLGLTVQCAHCHDHKYDPIRQEDYFSLRAFFEPMYVRQDRRAGEADPGPFQDYEYSTLRKVQRLGYVSVFDHKADAATWLYTGGDERNRQSDRGAIPASVPAFLQSAWSRNIEPIELPLARWYPGLHPDVQTSVACDFDIELRSAIQELQQARDQLTRWETDPALAQERSQAVSRADEAKGILDGVLETVLLDDTKLSYSSRGLLLDGRAGRRMIFNSLRSLAPLMHGSNVSFVIAPFASAHLNVQLTRDNAKGATASFVGFEGGRIKAYRPGTFDEFEVAVYDPESTRDQGPIEVRMVLDREKDQGILNLRWIGSDAPIASDIPIALHGWDPAHHPEQGILIDARAGAWGWFDEFVIRGNDGSEFYRCDFDANETNDPSVTLPSLGTEIVGHDGWEAAAAYCQIGGTSVLSDRIPNVKLDSLREAWEQADRVAYRWQIAVDAASAKVAWIEARRDDWVARTNAERHRYSDDGQNVPAAWTDLARAAHRSGHRVQQSHSAYRRAKSRSELAQVESLPSDAADRDKKLTAARAERVQAESEWQRVSAIALDSQAESYEPLSRQYPRTSTGRRAALAAWMTHDRNPLTARVAVNHLWARHFHQPLVSTVYDFGRNGARPSHPELLDWLAVELMESGWSMKHLHRLIVTSEAYRRVSSVSGDPAATIDPENRLLWRMNSGRMEAEVLRDSVLAIAGWLDGTQGGQELENHQSLQTYRRSIYYSCQPEEDGKSPLGAIFDGPDANECYRRTRTIVPQQSLALTNSDWIHRMSQEILKQIDAPKFSFDASGNRSLIDAAFERILGRGPSGEEMRVCCEYLERAEGDARGSLVRGLINHNDFVTIR